MTKGNVARKRACRAWRARANLRPVTRRRSRPKGAGDEHEGLTTHGPHGLPGGHSARRIICVCMPPRRRTESPTAADQGPKSPSKARVEGTTGRAGSGEQRRRRVGEACLHPVDQAAAQGSKDRQGPWSTAVRRRLDGRRLNADCHRPRMSASDQRAQCILVRGYSSCSVSAAAGRKGGRPPFSAPLRGTERPILLIS